MKKNEPIRVFEGNAKPFWPFWKIVDAAESESGESEIWFYGYISEFSWFGDEVMPGMFKADLDKLGGKPVTIRINSAGGEVFAASSIRAMIMEYKGKVTTRIDGLAASAATYVAMAGDVVKMQDSAFFMIHDPWSVAIGGVAEMKAAMEMLKTVKRGIIEAYQSKTQVDIATLDRWMANETWFTAQEALQNGFIDEVISAPSGQVTDLLQNAAILNAVKGFERAPEELRRRYDSNEEIQEGKTASAPAQPVDQCEAQNLRERVNKILQKEDHNA